MDNIIVEVRREGYEIELQELASVVVENGQILRET